MKLAVIKETKPFEQRVAITPEVVKKYKDAGIEVVIQTMAGNAAGFSDQSYKEAGAEIGTNLSKILGDCQFFLKVQAPSEEEIALVNKQAIIACLCSQAEDSLISSCASRSLSLFSMELIPRITRAQAMDVLSSQSNLAGYKAVIDAVAVFDRVIPMMITAAGSIQPAKALILGAGVAGLQAIATAKRLGAIVSAFDVRRAAKEQVESLGAEFVEVSAEEDAESDTGYAKETSKAYQKQQSELIATTIKEQDIVITTALIPGKAAPVLITSDMVKSMKPGSVIVDLATIAGGNCALSERDQLVTKHGVTIIGYSNMPSRVAHHASALYANNLWHFISQVIDTKLARVKIDFEDEIVQASLLTHSGKIIHPHYKNASDNKKKGTA